MRMFKAKVKLTFFHGAQVSDPYKPLQRWPGREQVGSQAAEPHPSDGTAYRPEQTYRLPSHNSKTVLSTVKKGPQRGTRTPSERQLNRQFPGSSTSQHNRSIELTLAEVIV